MKKIFLLAIGLIALQGFAQKTVYYFNFSSYTLYIGDIVTIKEVPPPAGSPLGTLPTYDYPYFRNTNTERGGTYITVIPGGSYVLENTANPNKFPFTSIGNTPQLTTWKRVSSATASGNVSSIAAFTVATPQVFHYTKFMIGPGGSAGGTTFASPKPGLSGAGAASPDVTPYTISTIDLDGDSIVIMISDN